MSSGLQRGLVALPSRQLFRLLFRFVSLFGSWRSSRWFFQPTQPCFAGLFPTPSHMGSGLVVLPSRQGSRQDSRLVLSFRVVEVFSLVFPANTALFRWSSSYTIRP